MSNPTKDEPIKISKNCLRGQYPVQRLLFKRRNIMKASDCIAGECVDFRRPAL